MLLTIVYVTGKYYSSSRIVYRNGGNVSTIEKINVSNRFGVDVWDFFLL